MLTKMNLFWTIFWTSESCVTSFSAPDGSQMQRSADCPQTNRNNCHNFPHLQEEQHVPFVYNPNETAVTTFPTYRRNDVFRLSTTQTKPQLSPPTGGTVCVVCHTDIKKHMSHVSLPTRPTKTTKCVSN